MKQLTILVPEGDNNLSSITGTYEIFKRANKYREEQGKASVFQIQLAGISEEVWYNSGLFRIRPEKNIQEIVQTDLIVIPSLNHQYHKAVKNNENIIEWLRQQYKNGAEIASICTGAFLLASTGLLDGRHCSTHWSVTDNFRKLFPKVKLQTERLITEEKGIYTNGGAYSFLNLIIYLIEKFYDRQTAIYCSKVFQIEFDRNTQSEFSIFSGQKQHDDDLIQEAQTYIENHFEEKISIEELSEKLNIGRRNFDRRFIRATGNTPLEYAQRVKIESAKKTLENSRKTIQEIMYEVGYSDIKAFREVFKKYTGISPADYKAKFNKDLMAL